MTDKEQIIIDGVDVSGCEDFREGYCYPDTGVCYKCDTNCQYAAFYLKEQLARKTQECEELKAEIKEIAEPFCDACQEFEPKKKGSNCMYCNYGIILRKISEALNK